VVLWTENKEAWTLFNQASPFVIRGDGSFDVDAVRYIFSVFDLGPLRIRDTFQKFTAIIEAITDHRREEREKEKRKARSKHGRR
jgi:hypothetical protein